MGTGCYHNPQTNSSRYNPQKNASCYNPQKNTRHYPQKSRVFTQENRITAQKICNVYPHVTWYTADIDTWYIADTWLIADMSCTTAEDITDKTDINSHSCTLVILRKFFYFCDSIFYIFEDGF